MASIMNMSLKNVRSTRGMEGEGFIANVYLGNKKIGEYADYGDGAMGHIDFVSQEAKEKFTHILYAYADKHPDEFVLGLFEKEPERIEKEKQRIRKYEPFISDDEMTINALSNNDYDAMIGAIYLLYLDEKDFKKGIKKGFSHLIIFSDARYYCKDGALEKMKSNPRFVKAYSKIEDFAQEV